MHGEPPPPRRVGRHHADWRALERVRRRWGTTLRDLAVFVVVVLLTFALSLLRKR